MLEKINKSISSCIRSVAVSFTTVTLEVTNTIGTWMPHYNTTSAYMLGPERLWHQSENEKVRFAFACQRHAITSLGDGHTFFSKSLQDYSELKPCKSGTQWRGDSCPAETASQEDRYLPLKARPYFSHPLLLQQQATWHQLVRHSQAAQKEYNFTKLPAASSPLPDMHVLVA